MFSELSFYSEKHVLKLNNWLWPLLSFIFRIEVQGLQHIKSQKSLLIANHNSGALIESHSLLLLLFQQGVKIFGLNHQALFKIPWLGTYFRKIGAVSASKDAAREVLQQNFPLLIFPGGNRQAFRPIHEKDDHNFSWSKGWAEIAIENQSPVIPIKFIGTHQINPIFLRSKLLSTILILPRLLKVTYFPVSLSQIVLSVFVFFLLKNLHAPMLINWIFAYLIFCLTPLAPLLPSKVKIKIYPPLIPNQHFTTKEELISLMAAVMTTWDYPHGDHFEYPLNGLEKFMHAHESKKIHYNSQLIFEFNGQQNVDYLLKVTQMWIEQIPHLRSTTQSSYFFTKRLVYSNPWFKAKDIFQFSEGLSQDEMDTFCHKKFELSFEPGIRFLLQSENQKHRLIFSCHHSLFDGAGQALAFECWSKIYNQQSIPKEYLKIHKFQYREIYKKIGLIKSLKFLKNNFSLRSPRTLKNIATLNGHEDHNLRQISSKTIYLEKHDFSLKHDLIKSIEAFNETLNFKNKILEPIFVIIPQGLRWILRLKSTLQNAVVSSNVYINRESLLNQDWKFKIEERLSRNLIDLNQKFLFGTLVTSFFTPSKKLQQQLQQLDDPQSPTTSSFLFVHAPIPKNFPLPFDWENTVISARGTLLHSPSIGIIITGQRDKMTLTLEFVKSLIKDEELNLLYLKLEEKFAKKEQLSQLGVSYQETL